MAVGQIYWKVEDNILIIRPNQETNETLWTQSGDARELPPWKDYLPTISAINIYYKNRGGFLFDMIEPLTMYQWFAYATITSFGGQGLTAIMPRFCKSFRGLFSYCYNLTNVNLSSWQTPELEDMSLMFAGCPSMTSIDIHTFDTTNLKNIRQAFIYTSALEEEYGESQIETININGFNTSQCTDFTALFQNQDSLTTITGIENIDLSSATTIEGMFSECKSITSLDLSNWNTSNIENFGSVFSECFSLATLNVENWDTSNGKTFSTMFGLLDVTDYTTPANEITELDLSNWNMQNAQHLTRMFKGCSNLVSLNATGWNLQNVIQMNIMFAHCTSLEEIIGIEDWNVSNCKYFNSMFQTCSSIEHFDLHKWNMQNAIQLNSMFAGSQTISMIATYDIADWNVSKVQNFEAMFQANTCEELDLANWNPTSALVMNRMFGQCTNLTTIKTVQDFTNNSATSGNMFINDTSLVGGNGTHYSSSYVDKTYARMDKTGQAGYFTLATRTITTSVVGSGTITGAGTYTYGTLIKSKSLANTNYYLDKIEGITQYGTELITDTDTISEFTYTFNLRSNIQLKGTFPERQTHTLTATSSEYVIQGQGEYKYLDRPVLLANVGSGLVIIDGWYLNDEKVSSANPFVLTMPDEDVEFELRTGEDPFTDAKVRQFVLQNGYGEIYKLTSHDLNECTFFNSPIGLGFSKTYTANRIGNSDVLTTETYILPQISGTIVFHKDTISGKYEDYYNFARFVNKKPIKLFYKTPIASENNTYFIPCEVVMLEKSEIVNGTLECPIQFNATEFWQTTSSTLERTSTSVEIFNDSDYEIGVDITCRKITEQAFNNPKIIFKQNDEEVGALAINRDDITKINLNTKDKSQNITLYNGEEIITNPFSFIDFSYADGVKAFPFPKLKQGYNVIQFTYDGMSESESNVYSIIYDKGYVSV